MGKGSTFLEQVTRINTHLGSIAQVLEGLRDAVAMGEVKVEEAYLDQGSHRTVIKISTISNEQREGKREGKDNTRVRAVGKREAGYWRIRQTEDVWTNE